MIHVNGVSKSYGTTRALAEVSFSVTEGEVLGFLGPNGAGKSTAMKIITTYLSPDEGAVTIDGVDVAKDPLVVRKRIGYLPERAPLYDDMRTREYLTFVARARGLRGPDLDRRLDWVFEATAIGSVLMKPINALSKGYRQRVGLAQALVHDPDILILDEPTSGLDPRQIIDIRNLIAKLAESKTIIFSSHILAEISAVTNRIVIINEGKIVADGQIDRLRQEAMKVNRVVVEVAGANGGVPGRLREIEGVTAVEERPSPDGLLSVTVASPIDRDVRPEITEIVRRESWDLVSLYAEKPTLEEAFIALTSKGAAAR